MGQRITVCQSDNIIEISGENRKEIPSSANQLLRTNLTFVTQKYVHGAAAVDPVTGEKRNILNIPVEMFDYDAKGRMVLCAGYRSRVMQLLQENGFSIEFFDYSPTRIRPNCYKPNWANLKQRFKFRPLQEDCIREMSVSDMGVVDCSMGFGKSFTIAALCLLYPDAKFAVCTMSRSNVKGLAADLSLYVPAVGVVGAGAKDHGRRVMIYTAKSLGHCDGDIDFFIGDEAHELCADSYSESIARISSSARRFGLTATPKGRFITTEIRLEALFGPTIYKVSYQDCLSNKLVVPITVSWVSVSMPSPVADTKDKMARYRWGVWRNDYRNQIIACAAKEYSDKGLQTLVLVQTLEHALWLKAKLPDYELCYGSLASERQKMFNDRSWLPDDFVPLSDGAREQLRVDFKHGRARKVIATDTWRTGVSFENLAVLVRADARDGYIIDSQGPGRVSRIADGKEAAVVVDFYDVFDDYFCAKSKARKKTYDSHGWESVYRDIRLARQIRMGSVRKTKPGKSDV